MHLSELDECDIEKLMRICTMHAPLFSNSLIICGFIRKCKIALQIDDETVDYGSAFGVRDWDPFSLVDFSQPYSNPGPTTESTEDVEKAEVVSSSLFSQSLSSFSTHVMRILFVFQ